MYWLDCRDILVKDILPSGAVYKSNPKRDSELKEALANLDSISTSPKSAVASDDYHQWAISASDYVDDVVCG